MSKNSAKLFNLLTVCRKAGRMTQGFDKARESMENHQAYLVLLASDISRKTEKEARFFAEKYAVPVLMTDATKEEYGMSLGKETAVAAVCDEGFAKKISELYASN